MKSGVTVRPPKPEDTPALVALLKQLGYPVTHSLVERQTALSAADSRMRVLVAELEREVVGLATGHLLLVIHEENPLAMLTALVVRDDARGTGIGRTLVDAIHTWARELGAKRIVVTSGLARTDAHAFYERIGYEHTARRFSRDL
jgi:GNAT superfamily N-acetyltransferase